MKNTKELIVNTFMNLVMERPLEKITIQDIADQCGINRNTFYYHFDDIYSLIESIFNDHVQVIENMIDEGASWDECSEVALDFLVKNSRAIKHIASSMSRDQLDRYMFIVFKRIFTEYLLDNYIIDVTDEQFDNLVLFYTYALIGCIVHNFIENSYDVEIDDLLHKFKMTLMMTNPLKSSKQSH